jgi:hypothetical protein
MMDLMTSFIAFQLWQAQPQGRKSVGILPSLEDIN